MKNFIVAMLILTLLVTACSKKKIENPALREIVAPLYDSTLKPFYHGVASGDPLNDRVVLWTRVTPEDSLAKIVVKWEIAEDKDFKSVYKSDTLTTFPTRDYTVKVDVDGLKPGRYYYYRFTALEKTSMTGRTKTISLEADSVNLAVVSCSNWEFGYFNAYQSIAQREVDAVVHLGDYIYEYAVGDYGDTTIGRKNLPPHEIVTLHDYRTRYSQYHTDKGLRLARQQHPFITIWDDHEVANNVYKGGAQNHQDTEGDFEKRKAAAKQAYYEWLPIRESQNHYRAFSFGSVADLIMLDERLEGRTKPVDSLSDPSYKSEKQSMLGAQQLVWLESSLGQSKSVWKVIGNQVIFSEVDQSGPFPAQPRNLDSWDGYPAERNKIAAFIQDKKINNTIFITGDTHASWAFEVTNNIKKYNPKTSQGAFAIEFGTPSISSSNWNEYATDDTVKMGERQLFKANPHLKYGNARDHGYLLLTLHKDKAKAEWWYVNILRQPISTERLGKQMEVLVNTHKLTSN
jgi:alkaline phosphatase D